MKWIVLAIVLVIVPYTFLTLHFRKPGPAYEPYHDMKERANTIRLLAAGFQRIALEADRPADPLPLAHRAPISPAPAGLPPELSGSLLDTPRLPSEILSIAAAGVTNTLFSFPLEFTCTVPDNKEQLAGAELYVHSDQMLIVTNFEKIAGGLLARSRESTVRLTVPAGMLKPGRYRATVIGERVSKAWVLEVR